MKVSTPCPLWFHYPLWRYQPVRATNALHIHTRTRARIHVSVTRLCSSSGAHACCIVLQFRWKTCKKIYVNLSTVCLCLRLCPTNSRTKVWYLPSFVYANVRLCLLPNRVCFRYSSWAISCGVALRHVYVRINIDTSAVKRFVYVSNRPICFVK